ncbi:MAG: hypothetical protein PHO12_05060 [Bacteroidales bacterium]|nr:hypothetical protein [Bacteroidales bacterium]MDD4684948.1 hypothetical protein [Bacteroidales bacterium]
MKRKQEKPSSKCIIETYTLEESGKNDNRWGWMNERTKLWEVPPTLTYYEACMIMSMGKSMNYFKGVEKAKRKVVRDMLKKHRKKINELSNQSIEHLKQEGNVLFIKDLCANYDESICKNKSNHYCFICKDGMFRDNNTNNK